ncbi:hypothetical protein NC981_13180 [Leptolyngbya sp. DQ-M1]|uniref:hypothetical protein n=1 Tax=Leptolyngbya sp. DQ-M1 TaxID=2933920 RepID=UPI00329A1986
MISKQKVGFIVALALSIALAMQLTLNELGILGIVSTSGFSMLLNKRLLGLEFLALCGLYLAWLIQFRPVTIASRFRELLKPVSAFLAVCWLSYPGTNDIYMYLQYGLISLNRLNPYLTKAGDFGSSITNLIDWNQSSTYGVVSLFFFLVSSKLSEINLFLGVYGFKLICLGFHILNSYLIWKNLKSRTYRDQVTLAYLISPVLLFEQVAEAHIDVMLCTVLIAVDRFLKTGRYLLALVTTGIGFLTKTLPIIWIPLIGVFLIRQRRWKTIVKFLFLSVIGILILHFTLFPTIDAWRSILNPGVGNRTVGSWHDVLDSILMRAGAIMPSSAQTSITALFNRFTLLLFAAYYAVTLYRIFLNRSISESRLMIEIGWVTFVLFAIATPWYQPWYATVLLPIAALNLQSPTFAIASFAFSLIGTTASLGLEWGSRILAIIAIVPTMGSPIVVLLMRHKITALIHAKFLHETKRELEQVRQ